MDYVSAGFDPGAFWGITLRLFDLHMQGALRRMEREADAGNRQSYNVAALTGSAMGGKMPAFDKVFRKPIRPGTAQAADVLTANLMAMARAWGATETPPGA